MARKKQNSKVIARQRHKRRQWLTFMRMVRYGINNFSRNAWLTIAATAVMAVTLLIIFTTIAAQNVLSDSVKEFSDKVDMSIYLKTDTDEEVGDQLAAELKQLSNVKSVRFISADESRQLYAESNKQDKEILAALNQATNRNSAVLRITLHDINDISQLDGFVKNSEALQPHIDEKRKPSFAGERRESIKTLGRWAGFASRAGLITSAVFAVISVLIVFNTIRMAIFNRKDEIYMMKLIGANRGFIRGPFVVEAIVYGVVAALLATGLGVAGLYLSADGLLDYGVAVQSTLTIATRYTVLVLLAMIILGAAIGVISSLLATRKYLRL